MSRDAHEDTARRIARNVGWLTAQEAGARVLALLTAVWLARTLDPRDYGALGIALAVAGFAMVVVRAGTGMRATRETARNPDDVPRIFAEVTGLRLLIAAILIAGLCAFSGPLGVALSVPPLLIVLSAFLLLRPALTVRWAFKGLDRMDVPALAEMVEKALVLVGVVLLVRGGENDVYRAPVIDVVAALLVSFGLYRVLARRYAGLRVTFAVSAWPAIAREALPVSLATFLGEVYVHGGVLLLGWFGYAAGAAAFLVSQKIMLTVAVGVQVLNKAAFPSASRLMHDDPAPALALGADLMRGFLVLSFPALLVLFVHAEPILGLVFGGDFRSAAPVLQVLLGVLPFLALATTLQLSLMAIPRPGAVLAGRLAGAAALLGVGALSVPRLGAPGAAWALLAGEAAASAALAFALHRAAGGVPWNMRCTRVLLAAGLATVAQYVAGPTPVATAAALVVFLVVSWLAGAVRVDDLVRLRRVFRYRSAISGQQPSGVQRDAEQHLEDRP